MTIEYKDSKRIVALSTDIVPTPTYSDDFSGTDGWADQGSGVGVNTTTDRLEFSSWTDNTTNNSSTLDLGSALSDTKWTIRFKLQWTGFSNTTDWTAPGIGMFSTSSATAGNSAQDMLFYWGIANGATKASYISSADNTTMSGTDTNLSYAWVLDTTYYFQLQRDGSSFTTTIWTGSYNGTEVASGTNTIDGTNTGLRYFGAKSPVSNRGGSFTGWLDDLQIWNGILATSLTSKPTDVQDNSILVEKNTARRYWFTPNTVTLQSDFSSSTGWTTSSSSLLNVDTSAQEIDFTFNVDNGDIGTMYYDLTSTSDTKWLLRSQIDIDTIAQGSDTSDKWLFYGLSSTNNGANETQDFLGMAIRVDNTKTELFAIETDGSAPNNESTTVFTRNAQAETLYVEMKRESATSFTVSLYSDSAYSTLLESKTITASSGTATLRYLKLSGLQGFSDSQIVGSIPNMTFYNSATELATWTMQPTWRDDTFSSGWTTDPTSGSEFIPNTSTNVIDFAVPNQSGFNDMVYYDLETISDDSWVLRFKWNPTTWSLNTDGTQPEFFAILTSSETANSNASQNALGLATFKASSTNYMAGVHASSASLGDGDLTNMRITDTDAFTTGNKWFEFKRTSATGYTVTIYSDEYSTVIESKTHTISSGITGLRYLKFIGAAGDGTTNGTFEGTIDDIEFYNGVSSIN